jgi:hypothetical protein
MACYEMRDAGQGVGEYDNKGADWYKENRRETCGNFRGGGLWEDGGLDGDLDGEEKEGELGSKGS